MIALSVLHQPKFLCVPGASSALTPSAPRNTCKLPLCFESCVLYKLPLCFESCVLYKLPLCFESCVLYKCILVLN